MHFSLSQNDVIIVFGGRDLSNSSALLPRNRSDGESDIQPLKVRVPRELVRDIDNLLSKRKPKISRHNWILEALYEKLERDSGLLRRRWHSLPLEAGNSHYCCALFSIQLRI